MNGTLLRIPRVRVATFALVVAATLAAVAAGRAAPERQTPCRVLPNGRVSVIPDLRARCPLEAGDRVERLEWRAPDGARSGDVADYARAVAEARGALRVVVQRDGREVVAAVPVVARRRAERVAGAAAGLAMALAFLALPLHLARRATSPAARPFALFYVALAILVFGATSGVRSPWTHRAEAAALIAAPCALAQLALLFPVPRPLALRVPGLRRLPWLAGAALVPVVFRALERDALLWPAVVGLLLVLCAALWTLLLAACVTAASEASSTLVRWRARLPLAGALALPAACGVAFLAAPQAKDAAAHALLASLALVPLPVGLALGGYRIFDLGVDARRLSARLGTWSAAALVGTALFAATRAIAGDVWSARSPLAWFLACLACAAIADGTRRLALARLERALSPRTEWLRHVARRGAARLGRLQRPEEVASSLARTLAEALAPAGVAVFAGPRWRPLAALGPSPPLVRDAALRAAARLGTRASLAVEADEPVAPEADDVALVAALRFGDTLEGLALLQPSSRGPYTKLDLELVETLGAAAGAALANARLAEELVESERRAALGRAALSLAHDIGKELRWIHHLARRLPERLGDVPRARRDLATLAELAGELAASVRAFVRGAAQEVGTEPPDRVRLADLLDRSAREVARRHGAPPAVRHLPGDVASLRVDAALRPVLANVLDNAQRVQPPDLPLRVEASHRGDRVVLRVRDRGPGLPEELRERVFDPGFTTRADGCGVGLALAREVAASLGAHLALESDVDGGLCAVLEVPCDAD